MERNAFVYDYSHRSFKEAAFDKCKLFYRYGCARAVNLQLLAVF